MVGFRTGTLGRAKPRQTGENPRAVLPAALTAAEPAAASDPLGAPLNIREAATLIGCSVWTVRQVLIRQGLPHFRSGSQGKLIFYRHQVIRWIVRHQRAQGGEP